MTTLLFSLLVPLLIGLAWHGFSLKLAVALAGEDSPGFFRAAWVSWLGGLMGGLAGLTWSWTLGLVVWFFSSWLSAGLGFLLSLLTTAFIYKKGLRLTLPTSLGVTGIHMVLSLLVNGLLGWFALSSLTGL